MFLQFNWISLWFQNNNAANAKNGIGGSAGNFMDKDGSIEVPGKGWCFVYIARYSYDPFQHSPNDNPEAELQVNAGDYILVWGEVCLMYFELHISLK